jgi:hypothetical protein
MKNPRFLFLVIYIFSVSITLSSCFIGKSIEASHMKQEFTEENDAIPPDFGKDNSTLLVILQGRNSYDNYVKRAVKNNYNGKYILVLSTDYYSGDYTDVNEYRYLFDYTNGSTSSTTFSNGMSASSTAKRYYIKDRLKDKMYQCGAEFGFFAKALEIYFQNLESKRISIQKQD